MIITFSIIEDNTVFRDALVEMLVLTDDLENLHAFSAVEEALQTFADPQPRLPDILLLDLNLPGIDGLTALPELVAMLPDTRIIVLTQNDNHRAVLQAISLGAVGYLVKDESVIRIRAAMREVVDGGTVIDPQLSGLVLQALSQSEISNKIKNPLTDQEQRILTLLAQGYAKKQVASKLDISIHTIEFHTRNIYKKLQVPNIASAIATAIRQKLI